MTARVCLAPVQTIYGQRTETRRRVTLKGTNWCLFGYLRPGITQSSLNIQGPGLPSRSFLSRIARRFGHAQTTCSVRVLACRQFAVNINY